MRRVSLLFVLFAILWAGAYYTYGYLTAATRLGALCTAVKPGMTAAELHEFARHNGLIGRPGERGVVYLIEQRTFGRYGCRLVIENGVVRTSTYHADPG